jgi:hypothetical protein
LDKECIGVLKRCGAHIEQALRSEVLEGESFTYFSLLSDLAVRGLAMAGGNSIMESVDDIYAN